MKILSGRVRVLGWGLIVCAVGPVTMAMTSCGPPAGAQEAWVVPRTSEGHPDLQGNWTNATMTPIERPGGVDRVLTPEQVAELEQGRQDFLQSDLSAIVVNFVDSDADFGLISIRTLASFLAFFGMTGILGHRSGWHPGVTLGAAL